MPVNTIYCTACGTSNPAGARFCMQCGQPLQPELSPAAELVSLSCPSCGGKLEITPQLERFACPYCGNEQIVRRSEGTVSLTPVVEGLKRVETKFDQVLSGSDRMAAEQTIQRLKAEIPEMEKSIAAKEASLQAIIPRESMHRIGRSLISLGSPGIGLAIAVPLLTLILKEELANTPLQAVIGRRGFLYGCLLFVTVCILLVIVGSFLQRASLAPRAVRVDPKNPNPYELKVARARAEVDAIKAELQKKREQLEQLNHYTAER